MYEEIFGILNVMSLGLIAGAAVGLLIGYAAKTQGPEWAGMTGRNKAITIALVGICSAIAITALSWRFLLH
jgi:ABC-type proline/glycine betaine transport system substrate-binding protein